MGLSGKINPESLFWYPENFGLKRFEYIRKKSNKYRDGNKVETKPLKIKLK